MAKKVAATNKIYEPRMAGPGGGSGEVGCGGISVC